MNTGVLGKVESGESLVERALGARGARMALVAGGTFAVILSTPPALIEQLAVASGIAGKVTLLAAPIGLGTRLALATGLAIVPAMAVWTIWGADRNGVRRIAHHAEIRHAEIRPAEIREEDEMMQAQKMSSGWSALIRLVRGGYQESGGTQNGLLRRRRRDRHPDAPPRPPLFASRDLPAPEPQAAAAPVKLFAVPPSLTQTAQSASVQNASVPSASVQSSPVQVAPPRAPEPLSDAEIAQAVATLPPRPVNAGGARLALLEGLDLPLIDNADLGTLAARFEHGLARREVVSHSQAAQQTLAARIDMAQPDPSVRAALRAQSPIELVATSAAPAWDEVQPEPAVHVDEDVEQALANALATLRKLTEKGRR